MGAYTKYDGALSTRAFGRAVIPSLQDEVFKNTEGTDMDFNELTDWITESGLRFEHKHNKKELRGNLVMRALRRNGKHTDLQKFVRLILLNDSHILSSLSFTRTFGYVLNLELGDYDLVNADSLAEFLTAQAEKVFGYRGAIRELVNTEGAKKFLESSVVSTYSVDNATFIKIPFKDIQELTR